MQQLSCSSNKRPIKQHQQQQDLSRMFTSNSGNNDHRPRRSPRSPANKMQIVIRNKQQIVFLLCAIISLIVVSSNEVVCTTNHQAAMSEVWSEGDGLHLKYSTNHDDLLGGSKGSELSLSNDQSSQQVEAPSSSDESSSSSSVAADEPASSSSAGTDGDSAAASSPSDETSSSSTGAHNQQQDEPTGESNGEQGADSRRNTEKIVPQSYSSSSIAHKQRVIEHQSGGGGSNSDDDFGVEQSNGASGDRRSSSVGKKSSSPLDSFSFSSSLDQIESPPSSDDGSSDSSTSGGRQHQVEPTQASGEGADESDAFKSSRSAALNSKFHQPGRLFKEAIRLNDVQPKSTSSLPKKSSSSYNDNESNEDESSSEASSSDEANRRRKQQSTNDNNNEDDDSRSSGNNNSNSNNDDDNDGQQQSSPPNPAREQATTDETEELAFEQKPINGKRRPKTFEEDSYPNEQPSARHNPSELSGANNNEDPAEELSTFGMGHQFGSAPATGHDFEGGATRSDVGHFEGPKYFRPSPGPVFQAAATHKERVIGKQQQLAGSKLASSTSGGSQLGGVQKEPQNYKQLAYFKNVNEQPPPPPQTQANSRQVSPAAARALRPPMFASSLDHMSPDSVRDNFISPGHYPGSMPHLNSAASETVAAKGRPIGMPAEVAAQAKPRVATTAVIGEQQTPAASLITTTSHQHQLTAAATTTTTPIATTSDKSEPMLKQDEKLDEDTGKMSAATTPTASERVAANELAPQVLAIASRTPTVTPEPEAQAESQQIMAPILVSTTTMAPLANGFGSREAATSTTTTAPPVVTSSTTTTTTQAPSLKRFKFRKYR